MNDELLLDQSELFRVTIQQSPVAMTMQDENHRLLMVNPAYCKLVGYDESELIGQDPVEFILAPDSVGAVQTDREDFMRGDQSSTTRLANFRELIHRDGQRIPVRLEVTVARDVNDRQLLCSTLIDMSGQQRAVEAIKERCDLFLREAHHRIKNDIQGVVSRLELSSTRHPQHKPAYDRAVSQLQSVADLRGRQFMQGFELDPVSLIESTAASMSDIYGRHVQVISDADSDRPNADLVITESESMSFALVVNELMTNACKHTSGKQDPFVHVSVGTHVLDLRISNYGDLPANFDLVNHSDAASGLGLVKALAPDPGLSICLTADAGLVTTRVLVMPPVSKLARTS